MPTVRRKSVPDRFFRILSENASLSTRATIYSPGVLLVARGVGDSVPKDQST